MKSNIASLYEKQVSKKVPIHKFIYIKYICSYVTRE
jgi:hypothetical protein